MRALFTSVLVSLCLVACAAEDAGSLRGGAGGDGQTAAGEQPPAAPGDPTQPGSCKEGAPHIGFGDTDFAASRRPGAIGTNRRRVKPLSALSSELQRTLGRVPAGLRNNAATFGSPPNRWYTEPTAGAVTLYTTYSLAFGTCFDTMTDPAFEQMPTAASAASECAKMQRKFWQRTPTPEETSGCAELLTSLDEPVAKRRWASACAAILTSTGFTTY